MSKLLVSACLLGEKVRYNAKDCLQTNTRLKQYIEDKRVVTICPEIAGGLPTPRPPAEIEPQGHATAVLRFEAKVLTRNGEDVSHEFRKGAQKALALAQKHGICCAILKARSPSCGSGQVYDGTHSKKLIDGMGVTAELLSQHDIKVFNETEIDAALDYIEAMDVC